jgi:hypothetical protein
MSLTFSLRRLFAFFAVEDLGPVRPARRRRSSGRTTRYYLRDFQQRRRRPALTPARIKALNIAWRAKGS